MHECPKCGFNIEKIFEDRCPQCGFNFNYLLTCPYRLSNKCVHNSKDCYIEGLNYELCEIYLHKSGIE